MENLYFAASRTKIVMLKLMISWHKFFQLKLKSHPLNIS